MTDILARYQFIRTAIPPVFILWTVLMLALTLLPNEALPDAGIFSYDKIGHFGMFGGWTFFLGLYIVVYKQNTDINLFILMIAGIVFGVFIEAMQFFLPLNRTASWEDIVANSLGCITAFLLLHPVKNHLKKKK